MMLTVPDQSKLRNPSREKTQDGMRTQARKRSGGDPVNRTNPSHTDSRSGIMAASILNLTRSCLACALVVLAHKELPI